MILYSQPERLDKGAAVISPGDRCGGLVDVAEKDEVFTLAVLPEICAVHEVFHGAFGFGTVLEEIQGVVKVAGNAMGELVAFVRRNIIPTSEVGARKFGRQFRAGFVGFDG